MNMRVEMAAQIKERGNVYRHTPFLCVIYKGCSLTCVAYGACFADYCDLYLTRVGHLILNLLGDISRETFSLLIINLVGTNDDRSEEHTSELQSL